VREDYKGFTSLGISNGPQKLYLSTQLTTPSPLLSSVFEETLWQAQVSPLSVFGREQTRIYEKIELQRVSDDPSFFEKHFKISLAHRWAPSQDSLPRFHRIVPGIAFSVGTSHALLEFEEPFRISTLKSSLSLLSKNYFIKAYETQNRINAVVKLGERLSLWNQWDQAYSSRKNFPLSFFSWGSSASPWADDENNYFNRGFSYHQDLARALLRTHLSIAANVLRPQAGLSWNRLRLDALDLRFLAESLSYSSLDVHKSNQLGNNFFSTLGVQSQFFGQTLGYVDYKISLGLFKGWGNGAQTRLEAALSTRLDL
jgi:hypothetical protein